MHRLTLAFTFAATLAATANAPACGLEDPNSISMRRGFLNIAFPESLHVGTAVWQAQMSGALPRNAVAADPSLPEATRTTLAMVQMSSLVRRFAARLASDPAAADHPAIALVMLGPVSWSRYSWRENAVAIDYHADGPAQGDVVLVADIPVIAAIVDGQLTMPRAFELGLARLYGEPARRETARGWLLAAGSN
jgi:hypothetical protein